MKNIYLIPLALLCCSVSLARSPFSDKISTKEVTQVCNAVADWQIQTFPTVRHHRLDWTNGALYKGISQWAQTSGQEKYYQFLKQIGQQYNWAVHTRNHPYHADDMCVGQMNIDLFRYYGDINMLRPTMQRAKTIADNPSQAPLQKNHKMGKSTRWSWSDALFMAPPVYAALFAQTGDSAYLNYLNTEFRVCVDSLYDPQHKLFYRDNMRIPLRENNGAKQFWGRGNGWVFGGLPLIIDNLPPASPDRQYYIALFKEMAQGVLQTQDRQGAWHASLLDPASYPQPENSASAFFCYGLAWGVRNGYLDAKIYDKVIVKAWKSLVSYVNNEGRLGYVQPIGHDPKQVKAESTEVYGVGAFLMAGSEMLLRSQER